jgi:CRISPR/Cas system CSM-associated protein Csm3 (group 7 of RAMP superfamily)
MIQLSALNQSLTRNTGIATIPLTAIIDTALCVGAGGSSGSLTDKPILKTAAGRLVIPASQLKGRLRHECEKLTRALGWPTCESPVAQTMCPQIGLDNLEFRLPKYNLGTHFADRREQYHCLICQLFGNPALPAKVNLSDLVCTEPAETVPEVLRPGVTINRRRRTAEEKKLFFLETSPANAQLPFTGSITLEPGLPDFAKVLLNAGFQHIHALGGSKSTGLGWLHWESPLFDSPNIQQSAWNSLKKAETSIAPQSTPEGEAS